MQKEIELFKKIRTYLFSLIESLSDEQLNEIPPGFNNNIIWNLGHLVAMQQRFFYVRTGMNPIIELESAYNPQSKPEEVASANEIHIIKSQFISSIDKLEIDYQNKIFENYRPFNTPYAVRINNIDDAIRFLIYHEGLHTGYIMALKRHLKN